MLSEVLRTHKKTGSWAHRTLITLFQHLLAETEFANPELVRTLQRARLKKVLRGAKKIPWWNSYFKKNNFFYSANTILEDIASLPPVTKQSFEGTPRAELLARFSPDHKRVLMHRTSGTTGTPFEWGVDRNILFVETAAYLHRAMSWYGIHAKDQPAHTFMATFVWGSYGSPAAEVHWSPADKDAEEKFHRIVTRIRNASLRVLFIYPTNLFLFAEKVAETSTHLPLDLILTTGQRLDDSSRDYVEKVMLCRVVSLYGSREFGQMATECPGRRHTYHVNNERLLVEITDEHGKRVPTGTEGYLTITSFENTVMPLIRYQLGDTGRFINAPCPCGRTLPLLEFFGREMDFIYFPSGKMCPFRQISPLLLKDFFDDLQFYQVVQPTLTQLLFRLRLKKGTPEEFETRIVPQLRTVLGNELEFLFEYPEVFEMSQGRKITTFVPLNIEKRASRMHAENTI